MSSFPSASRDSITDEKNRFSKEHSRDSKRFDGNFDATANIVRKLGSLEKVSI
jgi:hypothetical protein